MTIQVQCQCGKVYVVKDSLAGKTARCKECGAAIEIPGSDAANDLLSMAVPSEPEGQSWPSEQCCDKSGFLFKHACDREPVDHCQFCGRPVCEEHAVVRDDQATCSTCLSKRIGRGRRGGRGYVDDDWPYVYGPWHYSGYDYGRSSHAHQSYSHASTSDPNDFTEADGESLQASGNESFEADMTES